MTGQEGEKEEGQEGEKEEGQVLVGKPVQLSTLTFSCGGAVVGVFNRLLNKNSKRTL